MPRCEVATETSIAIMWTSKGGTFSASQISKVKFTSTLPWRENEG